MEKMKRVPANVLGAIAQALAGDPWNPNFRVPDLRENVYPIPQGGNGSARVRREARKRRNIQRHKAHF